MRIVAVLNQKGGVGKTTTAVNLGAALALRGRRVLLIDADPQGNLTDHLGLEPGETEASLYDVLLEDASIAGATLSTETEGLFVVPSEPDLAAAESELANELGREGRLSRALGTLEADAYDWVLIDCPPSLGLLSLNAMAAASELLITLQTEYFALKGLAALDEVIGMVQKHLNPELTLLGILPTLVSPVTILSKEVIEEVRRHYGEVVLGTSIRQNVSLAEAPSRGSHIFAYKPSSPGASDYLRLADEIEGRRDARNRSHATRVAVAVRHPAKSPVVPPGTPAEAASAASEAPMPPPETGRTPALEPELPPASAEATPALPEPPLDAVREARIAESGLAATGLPATELPETGAPETGAPETGAPETGAPESGTPESGTPESGLSESGLSEPGLPETVLPESGLPETGLPDRGAAASEARVEADVAVESGPAPKAEPVGEPTADLEPGLEAAVPDAPRAETSEASVVGVSVVEASPDPESATEPVELDADEARAWIRAAIARRTES